MNYMFIDTHCHLEMNVFDKDRDRVVERARDAGVEYLITIGSDRKGNLQGLDVCHSFPCVYSAVGIHPHDAKTFDSELSSEIKQWIKEPKVIAIGEIGLDYHYMHSPREMQIDAFAKQISIAKDSGLPIIVHSREANEDTLHILEQSAPDITGVLHCFSGDLHTARKAMDLGYYLSLAGPVTFKNAKNLRDIARFIPDERLLIETDAPYLSPVPMRGKRNEPSFLIHTASVISELRGICLSDIARITTLNAKRLFKIGSIREKGEIAYKIRNSLYLNITNRCTNKCGFCVKYHTSFIKGHNLKLEEEPSSDEIIRAVGDPLAYKEIVFCGIGEPLLRLETVKSVSQWVKENGGKIRINTNGHGNLIHKRNILPELKGLVDSFSISLDADDEKKYQDICRPSYKNAFKAMISFIKEAKQYVPEVKVTVVDIPDIDLEKCRAVADELGVEFSVREFNIVG
jgi:TatD DNase family protein